MPTTIFVRIRVSSIHWCSLVCTPTSILPRFFLSSKSFGKIRPHPNNLGVTHHDSDEDEIADVVSDDEGHGSRNGGASSSDACGDSSGGTGGGGSGGGGSGGGGYGDEQEDDDMLLPPPPPPGSLLRTSSGREVQANLARQVSYTVVDSEFVLRKRAKMVENIMDYGLSAEDATALLGRCHWTAADAMDGILEATDAMALASQPGPLSSSSSSSSPSSSSRDDAHYPECVVCGDMVSPSLLRQAKGATVGAAAVAEEDAASSDAVFRGDLGCGHVQCRECWVSGRSRALCMQCM